MSNVKISQLPDAGVLNGTELVPIVQSGVTSKTTAQDIADLAAAGSTPNLAAVLTVGNDAGAKKIVNLLAPTLDQDAATKKYVDDNSGGLGYLVYTALLYQNGTDAPVVEVLKNQLSGTPVWGRDAGGIYSCTLAGEFPASKTICFVTPGGIQYLTMPTVASAQMSRFSNDKCYLWCYGLSGGALFYADIGNTTSPNFPYSIEIRIYP